MSLEQSANSVRGVAIGKEQTHGVTATKFKLLIRRLNAAPFFEMELRDYASQACSLRTGSDDKSKLSIASLHA